MTLLPWRNLRSKNFRHGWVRNVVQLLEHFPSSQDLKFLLSPVETNDVSLFWQCDIFSNVKFTRLNLNLFCPGTFVRKKSFIWGWDLRGKAKVSWCSAIYIRTMCPCVKLETRTVYGFFRLPIGFQTWAILHEALAQSVQWQENFWGIFHEDFLKCLWQCKYWCLSRVNIAIYCPSI